MRKKGKTSIWFAASGHGFGHAAQTCAVASALRELRPDVRLLMQSSISRDFFLERVPGELELIEGGVLDPGIQMIDSLGVDRPATRAAYLEFHADWAAHLAAQTRLLSAYAPDVVVADIPYVSLAAAREVGIPAVALCSLNWADILESYFPGDGRIQSIIRVIRACYQGARLFLAPVPSMPMSWLGNRRAIGPLVRAGSDRRHALLNGLRQAAAIRLVVLAFGGIDLEVAVDRLPTMPEVHWLIQGSTDGGRPDVTPLARLSLPFSDVLASADAVITKPGYGIFTEAAYHGLPVVSLERPDWPETPYLINWLQRQVPAVVIRRAELEAGALPAVLDSLWEARDRPKTMAKGAHQAARLILGLASTHRDAGTRSEHTNPAP
jgi:hypothetical protein